MRKKLLAMLLCIIIAASNSAIVHAEAEVTTPMDSEIELRYANMRGITAKLTVSADTADCYAEVEGQTEDASYQLSFSLQRSTDKLHWSSIKSWSATESGAGFYSLDKSYSVSSGYYYRTTLTVKVVKGSHTVETETVHSSVVRK